MTREEIIAKWDSMTARERDAWVDRDIMNFVELTLDEAVDKFVDSCVHMLNTDGCYIDRQHELKFDKMEYDKNFSNGYYVPYYKKWLKENSKLVITHKPYTTDITAAWEAVELITAKYGLQWGISYYAKDKVLVRIYEVSYKFIAAVEAKTAPEAICLAALLAKETT